MHFKLNLFVTIALTLAGITCSAAKSIKDVAKPHISAVQAQQDLLRAPIIPAAAMKKRTASPVRTKWIEQPLDQFDPLNNQTWKQRYMVNDEFFQDGGAMFIYVAGEWALDKGMIESGLLYDMAEEHNGILYYVEHRFYGESKPTSDLTVANLQYLNVHQGMADLAALINNERATNASLSNSKVIMLGGSYSGSLITWFKQKYPQLQTGGWASSAPLNAQVDFFEQKVIVGEALRVLGGEGCYNRTERGVAQLEKWLDEGRDDLVKQKLNLCDSFNASNHLDVMNLFGTIADVYANKIQTQTGTFVAHLCNSLLAYEDDVDAIASILPPPITCQDFRYSSSLYFYSQTTYDYGSLRPWYWQTCSYFGWYRTTNAKNQPFGTKVSDELNTRLCEELFGLSKEIVYQNIDNTNAEFGSYEPNVENVYFVQGGLDPWRAMGLNEAQGATVITNASHVPDFWSISPYDSAELTASKIQIVLLVREWLSADDQNYEYEFE